MENNDPDKVKNKIICDSADLIVFSDPEYPCYVSSEVLRSVSPVFRAMLGPNFAEGQALLESEDGSLPKVKLEDDNRVALECLFQVLHHQSAPNLTHSPYSVRLFLVHQLAVLADKYDCIDAVAPFASPMFKGLDIRSDWGERYARPFLYAYLLSAAFLLDNAECFQKCTNTLIRTGEFVVLEGEVLEDAGMSASILKKLYQREKECREYLYGKAAELTGFITPFLLRKPPGHPFCGCKDCNRSADSRGNCVYHNRLANRYLEHLILKGLLRVPQAPSAGTLRGLINNIEGLDHPDHHDLKHCENAKGCGLADFQRDIDPKIRELKECARTMWAGLCLDCFNSPNDIDTICRVQHGPFSLTRDLRSSEKRKRAEESDSDSEEVEYDDWKVREGSSNFG